MHSEVSCPPHADTTRLDESREVARIFTLMERRLVRIAWRLTGDRDVQDDLLQEALIALWRLDAVRLDWSDREVQGYVYRALCRRMRSVWRRKRRRRVTWSPAFPDRRSISASRALWGG
jgi:DNA-directed RNA polymerase specialized sigma24 family protein